jgi:hypothetical protein
LVTREYEFLDAVANVFSVRFKLIVRHHTNDGGKALDILGYKSGRSVELGQVRTEVEVIEEEDCRTDRP